MDLRSRLARLPDGHPSSPYDDGGQLRPLPIRLKQLELGLPAPGREPIGSLVPEIGTDGGAVEPAHIERARQDSGAHPEPQPAVPDHTESRSASPEWADPSAVGNGHGAPDLDLGPWRPTQEPRVGGLEGLSGTGRNGHSRANGRSASHARATDADLDRNRGDRDRRDPGPLETAPQRPAQSPDRHGDADQELRLLVDRTLENCRMAEGKNAFGGYGSSGLTPAIERIAASLPFGGLAPGSETDTLKSPQRFAAKLARLVARNPGRSPADLAAAVPDAVRYAFVFDDPDYVEGTWLTHRRLKSRGFELEVRRNRWESPEYKGIFTQWRDPAHRLSFEVQFHTPASWAVVQRTHETYVELTAPATTPAERARLRARQVAAAAAAKAPPSWAEITDFRLEQR
jgi:hypothetical protein